MTAASLVGRVIDSRYRVDALIGQGGMGAVYRGTHLLLEQAVAIKVLLPALSADPTAAKRFVREAKSTFRLDHPHCVRVSDFGATDDGVLYLVMEYLDGRTVARELHVDGPIDSRRAARILSQCASALAHAHSHGLIHRDLKSENVMLVHRNGDPDHVKVLDFGLAKLWDADGGGLATMMSVAALTREGMTFGTPGYMSPEQALGAKLAPSSDLFSLGVLGYEMLTGSLPFHGKNPVDLLASIARDTPAPPSQLRAGVAPALEALLLSCMAKKADERPSSARALATELSRIADGADGRSTRARAESALARSETVELSGGNAPAGASAPRPALDTQAVIAQAGIRRPRKTVLAALISAALLAAAGTVLVTAVRSSSHEGAPDSAIPEPLPAAIATDVTDAGTAAHEIAGQPIDASAPDGGRADASPPSATPVAKSTTSPPTRAPSPSQRRARDLVREARAASTTLARMAKADAALRLDPGNLEAHYLFGDALVAAGKLERGCQHLRKARTLSAARQRLREAGCEGSSD